jgi:hypothetical protein
MKLYREITDGIIDSLLSDFKSWNLVKHENPKEDFLIHVSGNKVYVYSGSVVTPDKTQVNLPEHMKKEITEFTILIKRNFRKFEETRKAIQILSESFCCLKGSDKDSAI